MREAKSNAVRQIENANVLVSLSPLNKSLIINRINMLRCYRQFNIGVFIPEDRG